MQKVPLPRTFMLTGILGFMITTVYTASGKLPLKWGVAFDLVFILMFIASVLSITPPPVGKEHGKNDFPEAKARQAGRAAKASRRKATSKKAKPTAGKAKKGRRR